MASGRIKGLGSRIWNFMFRSRGLLWYMHEVSGLILTNGARHYVGVLDGYEMTTRIDMPRHCIENE